MSDVIVPDDKDWTWVVDDACPECGFDPATVDPEQVADRLRANAAAWAELHRDGRITPERPDASTWSSLEYACHVRDVYVRFAARIRMMLTEDDPLFENWDQDATAVEDRYLEQESGVVIPDLIAASRAVASVLDPVAGGAWDRPGRRSNGSTFTVGTIAVYLLHDPVHHLWDVAPERS